MKNLIYLILSGVIILYINCDGNLDDQTYRIQISNESADSIEINIFDRTSSDFIKKIELGIDENYAQDFLVNPRYTVFTPSYILDGDSLKIVFKNSEKFIIYTCDRSSKTDEIDCQVRGNILNFGDLKWVFEQNNDIFLRKYTFTDKDLEKAISCDGTWD